MQCSSLAVLVLAVAAPAYVIGRFAVNIPLDDEWSWVPVLYHFRFGTLGFGDLWMLHNEHRMFVPELLTLGLSAFGTWDVVRECVASVVLTLIGFFAWLGALRRLLPASAVLPVAAASATLVFSIGQYQNWLWGFQIAWLLIAACVLVAAYVVSASAGSWRDFCTLALIGGVASFSSAQGLLLGPAIGMAAMFSRTFDRTKTIAWWLFVVLAYAVYFHGFRHPAGSPDPIDALLAPFDTLQYFEGYIGNPLSGAFGRTVAQIVGIAGLIAVLAFARNLPATRDTQRGRVFAVCLLLVSYAILDGAVTSVARSGLGFDQGLASRYVTTCYPLWLGLMLALASVSGRLRVAAATAIAAIALLAVADAGASYGDLSAFALRERQAAIVFDTIESEPDGALPALYPLPEVPRAYAPLVRVLWTPTLRGR